MDHKEETPPINGNAQKDHLIVPQNDDDSVEEHLKHAVIIEAPGNFSSLARVGGSFRWRIWMGCFGVCILLQRDC